MDRIELSEYYHDENRQLKAIVYKTPTMYCIDYVKEDTVFKTESFPGKSIRSVEDAAENWALGIKLLNE
jgi:hypothetical protein